MINFRNLSFASNIFFSVLYYVFAKMLRNFIEKYNSQRRGSFSHPSICVNALYLVIIFTPFYCIGNRNFMDFGRTIRRIIELLDRWLNSEAKEKYTVVIELVFLSECMNYECTHCCTYIQNFCTTSDFQFSLISVSSRFLKTRILFRQTHDCLRAYLKKFKKRIPTIHIHRLNISMMNLTIYFWV